MGMYFQPGNQAFAEIRRGHYVDKSGLIWRINRSINTPEKLTCISRPRRFGKSFAAQMLCAYYDASCDSRSLFEGLAIAGMENGLAYRNAFHVLYLDISGLVSEMKNSGSGQLDGLPERIKAEVWKDMLSVYPELGKCGNLAECMMACVDMTGRKFIFILDEWDALIREAKGDTGAQEGYLHLLREWFKNGNFTPYTVAAAYMTGILPIKKDGSQSAISDFQEYSILDAGVFSAYTGFTEAEVEALCTAYGMEFAKAKAWYDGYALGAGEAGSGTGHISVYNPYSVMNAMRRGRFQSYWVKSSASEALESYVNMDFDGLQQDILRLIAGESIEVYTDAFANDFQSFRSRDDVLTLLIHLGYLSYMQEEGRVRIPNEEIRLEFKNMLRPGRHTKLAGLVEASEQLLKDTLEGREENVAKAIEAVREMDYAPAFYNNEQALRYVIKFAYIACLDRYLRVEELPSGHGVADVLFLPKKNTPDPAILIELKWNKTAAAAMRQIKARNYPAVLQGYGGALLLVGINYHEKTKKHSCKIERIGAL